MSQTPIIVTHITTTTTASPLPPRPSLNDDYQIHDRDHGALQPLLRVRQARAPVPDPAAAQREDERNDRQHDTAAAHVNGAQLSRRQV
ncbi:hypothetical protein IF2G_04277 [Cordyceps javanica]|nr:hypothetical protein IF2G_04277 [Cordyceps javanica]